MSAVFSHRLWLALGGPPHRHVAGWFDLYRPERTAIERLLDAQRAALRPSTPSIAGFNVGINSGEAAGQTVFHCHVHLIPPAR
jgi:ATP adenylyltransferase